MTIKETQGYAERKCLDGILGARLEVLLWWDSYATGGMNNASLSCLQLQEQQQEAKEARDIASRSRVFCSSVSGVLFL